MINYTYIYYKKNNIDIISNEDKHKIYEILLSYHYPMCMNENFMKKSHVEKLYIINNEDMLITSEMSKIGYNVFKIPRVLYDMFFGLFMNTKDLDPWKYERATIKCPENYNEYCSHINQMTLSYLDMIFEFNTFILNNIASFKIDYTQQITTAQWNNILTILLNNFKERCSILYIWKQHINDQAEIIKKIPVMCNLYFSDDIYNDICKLIINGHVDTIILMILEKHKIEEKRDDVYNLFNNNSVLFKHIETYKRIRNFNIVSLIYNVFIVFVRSKSFERLTIDCYELKKLFFNFVNNEFLKLVVDTYTEYIKSPSFYFFYESTMTVYFPDIYKKFIETIDKKNIIYSYLLYTDVGKLRGYYTECNQIWFYISPKVNILQKILDIELNIKNDDECPKIVLYRTAPDYYYETPFDPEDKTKGFSVSYNTSILNGQFDTTANTYNILLRYFQMPDKNNVILTNYICNRFYYSQNTKEDNVFFIPPLHPYLQISGNGEFWHARSKIFNDSQRNFLNKFAGYFDNSVNKLPEYYLSNYKYEEYISAFNQTMKQYRNVIFHSVKPHEFEYKYNKYKQKYNRLKKMYKNN